MFKKAIFEIRIVVKYSRKFVFMYTWKDESLSICKWKYFGKIGFQIFSNEKYGTKIHDKKIENEYRIFTNKLYMLNLKQTNIN